MLALKYRPKYWHTDDTANVWTDYDGAHPWHVSDGLRNAREQAKRLSRLRKDHRNIFHANARDAFILCDELLVMMKNKKIKLTPKLKTLIRRYEESSKEFFAVEDELEMEKNDWDLKEDDTRMIMDNWKEKMDSLWQEQHRKITAKELHNIIKKTFQKRVEDMKND